MIAAILAVTACSPQPPQGANRAATAAPSASAEGYPTGHVHGMSVDPGTDRVFLATHDGLFDVSESPAIKIGPTIDLMGFTSAGEGEFYASGHPGPGSDLPDPVGLIRSTDEGRTWQPLSRQGESDFHALASTDNGIVGFDGQLQVSSDGTTWESVAEQIPVFNLAATPQDSIVLATTEDGLQRSTDNGETWNAVPGAPLLMFTALSEGAAAGITPEGQIYTSRDAGLTWVEQGTIPGQAAAIATHLVGDLTLRIWVATETGVQVSDDNGQSFTDIRVNQE
nr:exo-alpha-sialidase [Arthrobacter sp. CAL618]